MTRARAAFVISRAQRHLPSYAHCTLDELLKFHADRGLPSSVLGEVRRAKLRGHLAKRLEEADEERRFESFLSLPPELRCLVYEWLLRACQLWVLGGRGRRVWWRLCRQFVWLARRFVRRRWGYCRGFGGVNRRSLRRLRRLLALRLRQLFRYGFAADCINLFEQC
jgi:hypothetical protein